MTKSSNASPEMFGFDFQVNATIVLLLDNIKNVKTVRMEGASEDIELTMNDGKHMSALLKKFSSALSVCDKYSFQSDPRFAWVDEMENDELYRKIISLPERDIDLLTLIAFEGYSQREVAEIRGIAPAAICKKIAKLKKLLYGG